MTFKSRLCVASLYFAVHILRCEFVQSSHKPREYNEYKIENEWIVCFQRIDRRSFCCLRRIRIGSLRCRRYETGQRHCCYISVNYSSKSIFKSFDLIQVSLAGTSSVKFSNWKTKMWRLAEWRSLNTTVDLSTIWSPRTVRGASRHIAICSHLWRPWRNTWWVWAVRGGSTKWFIFNLISNRELMAWLSWLYLGLAVD